MARNAQPFLSWVLHEHEPERRVGDQPGAYADVPGGTRVDLYASADLACTLHSLRRLSSDPARRAAWAELLNDQQDPLTGHFLERGTPTHDQLHATAYAVGALELLDALPRHPLRFADAFRSPRAIAAFLDGLDWSSWVYLESHRGAGIGSIFANVPALRTPSFFRAYFEALDAHLDPATGMHGTGKPAGGDLDQIGGTFHYAFLHETFHRPLTHPEARIDAVLGLQRADGIWDRANPWWLTLDAVYLLARAARRTDHRRADVTAAVGRAVGFALDVLDDEDARRATFIGPLGAHTLTAAVSLLAEAQSHLGADELRTDLPLRLVLDRRPFI